VVNIGQTTQKTLKFVPRNVACPNRIPPKKNAVKQGPLLPGQCWSNLLQLGQCRKQKSTVNPSHMWRRESCPEIHTTQSNEERERYVSDDE